MNFGYVMFTAGLGMAWAFDYFVGVNQNPRLGFLFLGLGVMWLLVASQIQRKAKND